MFSKKFLRKNHIYMWFTTLFIASLLTNTPLNAQTHYDVVAGNGNGFRFWNGSDSYKIHMGNAAEYHYGPVTGYSIKSNMSNSGGWGWTWGINGQTPVAALNNIGDFQIKGSLQSNSLLLNDPNPITDWNTLWQSGFYDGFNIPNAPEENQWFWGVNMNHRSNSPSYKYNGQIAIKNYNSEPTMYFRSTNVNGEGTWAKVLNDHGSQKISGVNPTLAIEGTGTGNYQGAFLTLSALGTSAGNEHVSTWFLTNRDPNGVAGIEFQRRNANGDYRGAPLLYKDGYGWRFMVAESKSSTSLNSGIIIRNTGDVGIGTLNPDSKLTVKGNIHTEEVKVDLSVPAPDYVFKKDYDLSTLEEVQDFINQNGHLPNIPSAKEMEKNGVEIGLMNMKLLEKIEELTLHLIQQKENFKRQEKRIEALEKQLNGKL